MLSNQVEIYEPLEVIVMTVSYDPRAANLNTIQPWFPEWLEQESNRVKTNHENLEVVFTKRCVSVTSVRRDEHVATTVLAEAKKNDADLIVMGARGHSQIGRILLGSVSDEVAMRAECSVLIVRPGKDAGDDLSNIMFAYYGSTPSRNAMSEMLDLDWAKEANMSLFSVAPIFDMMLEEGLSAAVIENQQEIFENLKRTTSEASTEISSQLPNARSEVEQSEHVGDAIVMAAEKHECDLVVIGDAGHNALHDMFLGSTTKYVLRHAPCSVWISRHHRKEDDSLAAPAEHSKAS